MSIAGRMSVFIRLAQSAPKMAMSEQRTAMVYGRRRASLTIHMECCLRCLGNGTGCAPDTRGWGGRKGPIAFGPSATPETLQCRCACARSDVHEPLPPAPAELPRRVRRLDGRGALLAGAVRAGAGHVQPGLGPLHIGGDHAGELLALGA